MQTTQPSGLRETQKEARRHQILETMMTLLSQKALHDITNSEIADKAGVSIPTLYNLIGNRNDILVHLLNVTMREVKALSLTQKNLDPVERAEWVGSFLVQQFTAKEDAYRQVIRGVNAISLSAHKSYEQSPHQLYLELMQEAEAQGVFLPEIGADLVASQLFQMFAGALITWAIEGLNTAQFSMQVTIGFQTVIAAIATPAYRQVALDHIINAPRPQP